MSAHLTPDQLLAVAEGQTRSAHVDRHLAACDACRAEAAGIREALAGLREAEVPEPSPLFWEQFSARVSRAVREPGAEARVTSPGPGWRPWAGWAWTLGGAAVTAALLTVAFLPRSVTPPPAAVATAVAPVSPEDAPESANGEDWAFIADAAGSLDYDEVRAIGATVWPGTVELAVQDLDADEQRELARLLEEAIAQARQPAGASETL
jgi:hypothetical protein